MAGCLHVETGKWAMSSALHNPAKSRSPVLIWMGLGQFLGPLSKVRYLEAAPNPLPSSFKKTFTIKGELLEGM